MNLHCFEIVIRIVFSCHISGQLFPSGYQANEQSELGMGDTLLFYFRSDTDIFKPSIVDTDTDSSKLN